MKILSANVMHGLAVGSLTLYLGGCCCCRTSFPPPDFSDAINVDDATDAAIGGEFDGASLSPHSEKDMEDARKYAQQALTTTGYGQVKSVSLQKDGDNWYVTGTATGLDGGDVSYNVWFDVKTFQNENQIRTTWAVKTVTVNGEVVYP